MSHGNSPVKTESEWDPSRCVGQGIASVTGQGTPPGLEKMKPFEPRDFHLEDYPDIDPRYLSLNIVSSVALPPSQSGIPQEAWLPVEWYRESGGSSVIEPNSVTEDNSRTYHGYKEGKYFLPNDAAEQDRLDLDHYSSRIMLQDRLYLAPIRSPKRVLDLATGTGIWPMKFDDGRCGNDNSNSPGTSRLPCDRDGLEQIQPEHPPANLQFIRDDAEEPWEFGPEKLNFIHARYACTCFDNPKAVMQQAFENLKPGGWIEYCDSTVDVLSMDGSSRGTTLEHWGELMMTGAQTTGRDFRVSRHYKQWLEEVGFIDVVERKIAGAVGPWCKSARLKQMGGVTARALYDNVTGMSYELFRNAGFTPEQIDELAARFRADLLNSAIHAYFPVWVVYGRKPE
ncbi:S-adenosyl-L-methionine-dependent methyltransferase [Apiospora aurea]|uniref:S-adenosyl-L-methionine-dependent methyltransferase n=1 Tax=Apiospora aurea TaxID=335848 RepID=A0ABR1QNT7_9PEZI